MQSFSDSTGADAVHQNAPIGSNGSAKPHDQDVPDDVDPDCPHHIEGPIVKVEPFDGPCVFFSLQASQCSVLFKNLLEDAFDEADNDSYGPIPVPNLTRPVLAKVRNWCEYHKNDAPGAPDDEERNRRNTDIEKWDQDFMQVDQQMLFDIILAANYLDVKLLLDIGCKTVANMIKGKSPEEIRKTFNIQNDFTPEEEEQIRRENEWAEDR